MKVQLSVSTLLALSSKAGAQGGDYLSLDAYGTELEIANDELEYDRRQNHAAGVPPTVSSDHTTLESTGNRWSAYKLPAQQEVYEDSVLEFDFALVEETADGFQAVCLDAGREMGGANGACFALSTTQGRVDNVINVNELTGVGETTPYSIPIGRFFTGTVNYLAFIQDSDGDAVAKSRGDSSISALRLVRRDQIPLEVEINGVMEQIENHQLSYTSSGGKQDTPDWLMDISEDGASVQVNGNQWKALPLNSPYNMTHLTILEFDIVVSETGDFHGVCLESDLDKAKGEEPCVAFLNPRDSAFFKLTTPIVAGEPRRLVIPYGQIMRLMDGDSRETNYIVFVQDDDVGDKRGGQSTYSNIRIYEEDRMDISISVFGENVTVPNIQDSFTSSSNGRTVQDSFDHVMSVSTDGKKVTAYGNSWKRFELPAPFEVKPSTMLGLHFEVPHEAEIHFFCLLGDTHNAQGGRNDCFATSGKDAISSSSSYKKVQPFTSDGGSNDFEIWIGSYFTGEVRYIAFAQDNDKVYTPSRAEGESSWSDIRIYALPSLNIGLDGSSFAIENNQVSYESSSQDSTPIGDHLAVISDDGLSITAHGNMWRAFPLDPAIAASDLGDFVVSFDYLLVERGEIHAVCFEDNLDWGDYDDPKDNEYDPKRCVQLNLFEPNSNKVTIEGYEPAVGEPHRYVINLSKLFERFYEWKYFVIVSDNDVGDKSGGEMTISNIQVTTSLASCMKDIDYDFVVSDCTVQNFLAGVKSKMTENACHGDPLLELMALFDSTNEMDVYREIEFICSSSYKSAQFNFAKTISSEKQVVGEFIDGGTALNYEHDSEGSNLARDGASIGVADRLAASRLLTWPEHHALDRCDVGAAMCCWVDSRGDAGLADNADVCYVDMKASRRTAHVRDGYSVYGESNEGAVNCHGFAWGTDGGSVSSALKGNALFKVGFMDNFYKDLRGSVEQVPGAPMCGCLDRMPVVTNAACTKASDDTSTVEVSYDSAVGRFSATFMMGAIKYEDCGDLNSYYKTVVGENSHLAAYVDTRIVGADGCRGSINDFLLEKGLVKG